MRTPKCPTRTQTCYESISCLYVCIHTKIFINTPGKIYTHPVNLTPASLCSQANTRPIYTRDTHNVLYTPGIPTTFYTHQGYPQRSIHTRDTRAHTTETCIYIQKRERHIHTSQILIRNTHQKRPTHISCHIFITHEHTPQRPTYTHIQESDTYTNHRDRYSTHTSSRPFIYHVTYSPQTNTHHRDLHIRTPKRLTLTHPPNRPIHETHTRHRHIHTSQRQIPNTHLKQTFTYIMSHTHHTRTHTTETSI